MHLYFYSVSANLSRQARTISLAFFSCVSAFIGIQCGRAADDSFLLLMRMAAQSRVSIVGLFFSSLLPFLTAALAVIYSKSDFLLAICSAKVFCFALMLSVIRSAYGCAGWIISAMLLFSDAFATLALFWFSFRHISRTRAGAAKDLRACIVFSLAVSLIDLVIISPFFASVMNF